MRRGSLSKRQAERAATKGERVKTARQWPEPARTMSDTGLERIHAASTRLLQDHGIAFMAPEAWDILEPHGVRVDRESGVCRFPLEVVEEWIAHAPSRFRIEARDPALSLEIGSGECHFAFGMSAPFVIDASAPRRAGNTQDPSA